MHRHTTSLPSHHPEVQSLQTKAAQAEEARTAHSAEEETRASGLRSELMSQHSRHLLEMDELRQQHATEQGKLQGECQKGLIQNEELKKTLRELQASPCLTPPPSVPSLALVFLPSHA